MVSTKFQVSRPPAGLDHAGEKPGKVELEGGTREVRCEMFELRTFSDPDTDSDTDPELIGEGG